ncbi:type II/IV secretion system ATPase subunit [Candidatus Halobonum tyrrellensis]|uniref:Type II secretion system protein E n=1 Tax=Candidatus Halobonum tyrrellensis G22 TaxID=1324957 RepID=V4HNY2_9EURY|nr:type II/IV secretion system ATPase subunit [Candidatus Halobonum tyrrellensis]ESP89629.1 type II secretion system protein E [Candidatus Halobonum tyrrellensis G22]
MTTDDAEASRSGGAEGDAGHTDGDDDDRADVVGDGADGVGDGADGVGDGADAETYTWVDFLRDRGETDAADALADRIRLPPDEDDPTATPGRRPVTDEDLDAVGVDPAEYLGTDLSGLADRVGAAGATGADIADASPLLAYDETPVWKDIYTWDDYEREYFLDEEGNPPTDEEDEPLSFTHEDRTEALGFDPDAVESVLGHLSDRAPELDAVVDERTVNVAADVDEDEFFSDADGETTLTNRYDLEKAVPIPKKTHFEEVERYWVNEPYSFVIVFHSSKENEKKYYVVEPALNRVETELSEFFEGKLRSAIKYADEGVVAGDESHRRSVIREETYALLDRYDLYDRPDGTGLGNRVADALRERGVLDVDPDGDDAAARLVRALGYWTPRTEGGLEGIAARPEPAVLAEDPDTLTEYAVEKLLYYLERDFVGYERIDGIKHDINVEDVSCDGYDSPVFVYHSEYEQIISNVYHGEDELDDFVVKLAQRSGKGISKRRPQVDATLPDGSRAQLTLGREVSDHGTNYTIRQFKDVPFTPIDLINWNTFSLEEMAFIWLCIENDKSLLFAGGTASGKTTSLNAVSLFIPSNSKIVSIEDTREVELPQRNWIASVTRPSFSEDDKGDVDEFDLLEAALRQRPDYIVMGEVRGEEGRTLFQVMSTGHTTYTTFHADNVGEVLKRFTTDPINVSKTMFTALDLVSIQSATRVRGRKVRRNKSLTEINHYDAENDEINVQDVYQWQAETDEFLKMGESNTLREIQFDRGWTRETLEEEMLMRQAVLAYLIDRGLNTYTQVAATLQAFINDPETIVGLMATDGLETSLEDLREMESVLIDVDPDEEAMVPRPEASDEMLDHVGGILDEAEPLFDEHRAAAPAGVADALDIPASSASVEAEAGAGADLADPADGTGSGVGSEDSPADAADGSADDGSGDAAADADTRGDGTAADGGDDPFAGIDDFDDPDDTSDGDDPGAAADGPGSDGGVPSNGAADDDAADDSTDDDDTDDDDAAADAGDEWGVGDAEGTGES